MSFTECLYCAAISFLPIFSLIGFSLGMVLAIYLVIEKRGIMATLTVLATIMLIILSKATTLYFY